VENGIGGVRNINEGDLVTLYLRISYRCHASKTDKALIIQYLQGWKTKKRREVKSKLLGI
jgi:hypothetical protein